MSGWPVWLASGSLRNDRGDLVLTGEMRGRERVMVTDALLELLHGIGDPEHERCFRMNATICIHRALSSDEEATLSAEWCALPAIHLAGGPVELLWSRGVQDTPSVRPCKSPGKRWLDRRTWVPVDCGRCAPCRARLAIEESVRQSMGRAN